MELNPTTVSETDNSTIIHYVVSPEKFPAFQAELIRQFPHFGHKSRLLIPASCEKCISGYYCGNKKCIKRNDIFLYNKCKVVLLSSTIEPVVNMSQDHPHNHKHPERVHNNDHDHDNEYSNAHDHDHNPTHDDVVFHATNVKGVVSCNFSYKFQPVKLFRTGECSKHCGVYTIFRHCRHKKMTEDRLVKRGEETEIKKLFFKFYIDAKSNNIIASDIIRHVHLYKKYNNDRLVWLIDNCFVLLMPSNVTLSEKDKRKLEKKNIVWFTADDGFETWRQRQLQREIVY